MLALELSGSDTIALVVIGVLLMISIFLAVAETALTRLSRARAQSLAEEGRRGAVELVALVADPRRFLNPVLFVVLVCQLVQATLIGVVASNLFGAWGVAVATFVNVVVMFVLAESAPKTWALQHPDSAALFSARPVAWLVAFAPIRWVSRGLIGMANVILPGKGLKDGPFVSEEELLAMADVAVEDNVIAAEERVLIEQIIEFGDTVVREVMVPRTDMVAVPSTFRVADVIEVAILNGFSRLPAYGEGVDDIVGLVYVKDLMRAERDGQPDAPVLTILRAATFVPETKHVDGLLREMQATQSHMAIVVDEYGGTAGLVTLEDLIEELVGEIFDEFDREESLAERLPDGAWRVNARIAVDALNEELTDPLPEGDWDTVGGLLFHHIGRAPRFGDRVDIDGWRLTVERVQGRRVVRARIEPLLSSDPPGSSSDAGSGKTVATTAVRPYATSVGGTGDAPDEQWPPPTGGSSPSTSVSPARSGDSAP